MRQYRLLKDLPGHKAGEIIELQTGVKSVNWSDISYEIRIYPEVSDLFEEVNEFDVSKHAEHLMRVAEQAEGVPGYGVSPNMITELYKVLDAYLDYRLALGSLTKP